MRVVFVLSILLLLFIEPVGAQEEQFLKANNAYNGSDYRQSIELYNEILNGGNESSDLYLNLGNAYLKNKELGKSILSYEKGLKIDKEHLVLAQNLKYANKQIKNPITAIPDFFLSRYWHMFVSSFGSTGWAVIQIILFVLVAIAIVFWLLGKQLGIKKMAFYSLMLTSFLLLISILTGTQKYGLEQKASHAVVVSTSSKLLTGASPKSELLIDLSEGVKVKLLDRIDEYYKVQLMDKEIGWISSKEIEAI